MTAYVATLRTLPLPTGSQVFIPTDNPATAFLHWVAVLASLAGFTTFFVGGFVVAAIQEE